MALIPLDRSPFGFGHMEWIVAFSALAVIYTLSLSLRTRSGADSRRPPGPRGLPVLGNLLDIPGKHLATYFRQLCEEYGGLVSLNFAGFASISRPMGLKILTRIHQRIILLGNMTLARELLEKRSAKFSSRPIVPYALHYDPEQIYWTSVSGRNNFLGRKLTAGIMAGVRAGDTELLQQLEALVCTTRLLEGRGKDWMREIERTSASMILSASFGLHCPTGEEPELKEVLTCLTELVQLGSPSGSIINALPFLDIIPGPMPWRKRAAAFRKREDALYDHLVTRAVSGEAAGMNTWAAVFASNDKTEGDQRKLLNILVVKQAGIETTASSLQTFVLACLLFPQWVARAQKESDAVVGKDRIPTFKDRPQLPYIEAVVRARFGLPHECTADDVVEYQGKEYLIPKGSIVFAVTWAIEHDKKHDDADEFRPDRFLDVDGKLRLGYETSAFGFGRRVCPGQSFAERSLWINIAMMLWTFDIRKSTEVDAQTGSPFDYGCGDAQFNGAITNPPLEFLAVFKPRTGHHAEVVRQEWVNCEKDLNVLLPQRKGP
ncbi:cytochrome P450 [Roridomyces roridus]|uniref:Cytochrome P450 n=1 Tax=Roridomyces roridus TaxID=1738132 RepID=A0AAD7BSD8_9AGAR|nr:cytochrome P450 [Roridomyces roridus]